MYYSTIRENPNLIEGYKSRDLVALTCSHCQQPYKKAKNFIQGKISKGTIDNHCSPACAKSKNQNLYKNFSCEMCGKAVTRLESNCSTNHYFCSHSCSATFSNSSRIKHRTCINCGVAHTKNNPKFCTTKCNQEYLEADREIKIKAGLASAKTIKKYLLRTTGCTCSVCKLNTWNNVPIPIELEHIDGNSENNTLENCCLVCPNCHALTPTYKVKNKGNGRYFRRERYKVGKSY